MESVLLDAAGHRRSPATMPGHHRGRPPRAEYVNLVDRVTDLSATDIASGRRAPHPLEQRPLALDDLEVAGRQRRIWKLVVRVLPVWPSAVGVAVSW